MPAVEGVRPLSRHPALRLIGGPGRADFGHARELESSLEFVTKPTRSRRYHALEERQTQGLQMSATTPYLQVDGELACASCGRTLLLGERYEPGPAGDARCELCRNEPPPAPQPAPATARDRIRLAWLALMGARPNG
jgi:hypothetical protein